MQTYNSIRIIIIALDKSCLMPEIFHINLLNSSFIKRNEVRGQIDFSVSTKLVIMQQP